MAVKESRNQREARNRRRWRRLVLRWQRSDLTQAEFCRRHGLNACTFSGWKRRFGGSVERQLVVSKAPEPEKDALEADAAPEFVEARIVEPMKKDSLEVSILNKRSIRVHSDFDPALLRKLVLTLESLP